MPFRKKMQIVFALHISENQTNFPVFTGVLERQGISRCQTQVNGVPYEASQKLR